MPDLCIKIEYNDPVKDRLSAAVKMFLPFWTILPIVSAVIAFSIYGVNSPATGISIAMVFLLIPVIGLTLLKLLSNNQLLLDKRGIEAPPDFTAGRTTSSYLPWHQINKVFVAGDTGKEILVFQPTDASKEAIKLPTNRMDENQLEKLLVTVDLMQKGEKDESLLQLADQLKANSKRLENPDGVDPSYTDIWEDELKRRFRPAAFMPLEVNTLVRKNTLTIVRPLALGGLSAVYLAKMENGKLVVLKESVVPDDYDGQLKEKAREMFAREAQFLMKLQSTSIVQVLDYFVDGGRSYLMLDHVTGPDLRQYVRQHGAMRESLVLDLAKQMAEILDYLHSQNPPIIHRDFTPDNLVLQADGKLVAIDFGAANEFIGNATGTFVGKHAYISPEQFRGKATPQSDIYALGGTLYYLLTGEDPQALSTSQVPEGKCSPDFAKIIEDCTQVESSERIKDACQLKSRLSA